jgi:hypothetical protein
MPFQTSPSVIPLEELLELAKKHLTDTVNSYKANFGRSGVDQIQLVPELLKGLVWWLFPSQVQSEL